MGLSNRERRAAKQRRRDERRSRPGPEGVVPSEPVGRGLPAQTLRRLLVRAGEDVAAGREEALAELRHLLAEHLARRRTEILAACDEVVGSTTSPPGPDGPAVEVPPGLAARLGSAGAVSSWAEDTGTTTEQAAIATVRLLAAVRRPAPERA